MINDNNAVGNVLLYTLAMYTQEKQELYVMNSNDEKVLPGE